MGGVPNDTSAAMRNAEAWTKQQAAIEQGRLDAAKAAAAATPDSTDEAVQNARIMERRRQIGMNGRMSTFLTTAQSDSGATINQPSTVLGG